MYSRINYLDWIRDDGVCRSNSGPTGNEGYVFSIAPRVSASLPVAAHADGGRISGAVRSFFDMSIRLAKHC